MSWIGTIAVVLVGLCAGLYVLLHLAILITSLVEKRPIKQLVPIPDGDPEWASVRISADPRPAAGADDNPYGAAGSAPYQVSANRAANALGFLQRGLFRTVKGGIIDARVALWLSPSRDVLAVVSWGKTTRVGLTRSVLYTALDDGRYLVTSDRPSGSETPGLHDHLILMNADFDRLLSRHHERLRACGRAAVPFTAENTLDDFEAIRRRRAEYLVASADAYFIDPEQTAFRSTLKGALEQASPSRIRRLAIETVDRSGAVRPMGAGKFSEGDRALPAPLRWIEQFCFLTLLIVAFMNFRSPATNPAQRGFRMAVILGCGVGLGIIWIAKLALKRKRGPQA